jgi:NAD(P)H-flavin reductase
MERNMQCAVGRCGHCQFGAAFVCRDGPVFNWGQVKSLLAHRGF